MDAILVSLHQQTMRLLALTLTNVPMIALYAETVPIALTMMAVSHAIALLASKLVLLTLILALISMNVPLADVLVLPSAKTLSVLLLAHARMVTFSITMALVVLILTNVLTTPHVM